MAATIKIKNSSTAGAAPTSSDLVQGELAVNVTDKRLYTENASGTVVELGTNPSVPVTFPDGSASAPSLTNDGDTNTGLFFPAADTVGIATGGTERLRLDSSGNLGLGVTPSAWGGGKAIELGTYSGNALWARSQSEIHLTQGYYNNGTNFIRTYSGAIASYQMYAGNHSWLNAGSGTVGNTVAFTQAMTLDASGNLGVGTTSFSNRLTVAGTGTVGRFISSNTGVYIGLQTSDANGVYIGSVSNSMIFQTADTERARIDSSGNLLVGTTSTGNARILGDGGSSYHGVRGTVTAAGNVGIYGNHSSNSATGYVAYFQNTGSGTGLYISNTAAWQSVSDSRLKDDVRDLNTTSKLLQLRPVDYLWKNQVTSDEPEKRSLGFIAQEVQELFPELVGVSPDGFLSVEYTGLIAPLVKAIQEQQALITQLQADVAALKGNA